MGRRRLAIALLLSSGVLLLAGFFLAHDNLSVDISTRDVKERWRAGTTPCTIAPYDAGLYGNDDSPGGEHSSAYSDEMATECYRANLGRFRASVGLGVGGLVLAGVGGLVLAGTPRRSSTTSRADGRS